MTPRQLAIHARLSREGRILTVFAADRHVPDVRVRGLTVRSLTRALNRLDTDEQYRGPAQRHYGGPIWTEDAVRCSLQRLAAQTPPRAELLPRTAWNTREWVAR